MVGYVYLKSDNRIHTIINNVMSIEDVKINGEGEVAVFGNGSEYIILQNAIDKNIDDVIEIDKLDDCRDFFLKTKEEWFQEQLQKQQKQMQEQQEKMERLLQLLEVKEE